VLLFGHFRQMPTRYLKTGGVLFHPFHVHHSLYVIVPFHVTKPHSQKYRQLPHAAKLEWDVVRTVKVAECDHYWPWSEGIVAVRLSSTAKTVKLACPRRYFQLPYHMYECCSNLVTHGLSVGLFTEVNATAYKRHVNGDEPHSAAFFFDSEKLEISVKLCRR
jgi:hypothetical protein